MTFDPVQAIRRKRDGGSLTPADIDGFISGAATGAVPDYQLAALLMAIVWRGLAPEELALWTEAMIDSGDRMDLAAVRGQKVDKHSTGGVGDKVSICLAPAVAACGVVVPMISGRGLGHTGGTLDKLEAIPGFTVRLDPETFRRTLTSCGFVLAGQSDRLAPADRKLYSLRDVTGTVESIPLIASSIMSKKLAEGIDGLVLDVKVGRGAFMKEIDDARELARTMQGIGRAAGCDTVALLTAMDAPLGRAVGNANETAEALDVLRGAGPPDLVELTLALGAEMLALAGVGNGTARVRAALSDGSGYERFEAVCKEQGGDLAAFAKREPAPHTWDLRAPRAGYVRVLDAEAVGIAALHLGAGRLRAEDAVDHDVGITVVRTVGDPLAAGDTILELHHRGDAARLDAAQRALDAALEVGPEAPPPKSMVLERIGLTHCAHDS